MNMTAPPLLRARGVTRRFGGLVAVNDVSLDVRQGEVVGIIGPNGAGKTTLFSLLSGFQKLDAGEVLFDGASIPACLLTASRRWVWRAASRSCRFFPT